MVTSDWILVSGWLASQGIRKVGKHNNHPKKTHWLANFDGKNNIDHSVSYAFGGCIETFDNYVMILTRIQLLRSFLGCFPFKNLWFFQSTHFRCSEVFSSGRRNPHPKWSGSQLANGTSTVKMGNRLISGCSVVKLFKSWASKNFQSLKWKKILQDFLVHKRFLAHFKRTLPGAHRNKAQKPGWEFSRPPNDTWPPVQGVEKTCFGGPCGKNSSCISETQLAVKGPDLVAVLGFRCEEKTCAWKINREISSDSKPNVESTPYIWYKYTCIM